MTMAPPRYNAEYGYNEANHALMRGERPACYNPYYQYYQSLMAQHAVRKAKRLARKRRVQALLVVVALLTGAVAGTMLGALW